MVRIGVWLLIVLLLVGSATAEVIPLLPPPPVITSSNTQWDYEAHTGYTAYFNENPNAGYAVSIIRDGIETQLLPHSLQYRNDNNDLEYLNGPQSVTGTPTQGGTVFFYEDAYGTGVDLQYTLDAYQVKEELVFASAPSPPAQYIIDGGNPVVELAFQIGSDGRIFLDGVEWDEGSTVTTSNPVQVRNLAGALVYTLPVPYAEDDNGDNVTGYYEFKTSANKLYVGMRIPYSFFQTATYPVKLDPTFLVDYSPVPAQHLINGEVTTASDNLFETVTDISAGVSDSLDTTRYETRLIGTAINNTYNHLAITFAGDIDPVAQDSSGDNNDLTLIGSPTQVSDGFLGPAVSFDNTAQAGLIGYDSTFIVGANESVVFCFAVNGSDFQGGNSMIDKRDSNNEGWEFRSASGEKIDFGVERSGGTLAVSRTTTSFDDGLWHTVCGVGWPDGRAEVFVDSVSEDNATGSTGSITDVEGIHVSNDENQGNDFEGQLDELCLWVGETIDPHEIINDYETDGCGGTTDRMAISGSWNETYDADYDWFLRVRKITRDDATVIVKPYYNATHINSSMSVEKALIGTGWFNIEVNTFMDYMNATGMNFSKLRFYSNYPHEFSEVQLRKEKDDITPPNITNCQLDTPTVGCVEQARFHCTITDDVDVENSTAFGYNTITMIRNDTTWEAYSDLPDIDGTALYNWNLITSCDINGNCANETINFTANYSCTFSDYINIDHTPLVDLIGLSNESVDIYWTTSNLSDSLVEYGLTPSNLNLSVYYSVDELIHQVPLVGLTEDTVYYYNITSDFNPNQTVGPYNFTTNASCLWVPVLTNITTCAINNTLNQQLTYDEVNGCGQLDGLPGDNGTITEIYCNYCTPDWNEITGGIHECQSNSTRYVEYVDYNTCYFVTNLTEDEPPYDHETWVSCIFYTSDFNCSISDTPFLRDKMEYECLLPYNGSEWSCVNKVSYEFDDVLQVNPQKKEKNPGGLIVLNPDVESREHFTTSAGILNAYFTDKNLVAETPFTITTTCREGTQTLVHQKTFTPELKPFHEVPTWYEWIKSNAGYVIGAVILLFVLLFLLAVLIAQVRRSR